MLVKGAHEVKVGVFQFYIFTIFKKYYFQHINRCIFFIHQNSWKTFHVKQAGNV